MQILSKDVFVTTWPFIGILDFLLPENAPAADLAPCSATNARAAFREAGWDGKGEIRLLWIPPFLFAPGDALGVCMWHARDAEGVSWLCSPRHFFFPGFERACGWPGWRTVVVYG